MQQVRKTWIGQCVAIAIVLAGLLLSRHIVANPAMAESMARGLATPLTWPNIMLSGVVLFALGWAIQSAVRLIRLYRHHRSSELSKEDEALEFGDLGFEDHVIPVPPLRVVLGIVLALVYAFSIPVVGFTSATLCFLVLWFLVGGIRSPLKLVLVSGIGVVTLLYVFVKLALMPLPRGAGVLGDFTVGLFRVLGIY